MPRGGGGEPLNRRRLVEAALKLIDEGGMEALSMRRLGARLGVDPMAIYYHVANKRELIQAVVSHVFLNLGLQRGRGDWRERVRRWAGAYRDLVLGHPNLVAPMLADPDFAAVASRHANHELTSALKAAGLEARAVEGGAALVVDYVNGYSLGLADARLWQDPTVAATAQELFDASLDIVIAGLASMAQSPESYSSST
jgi:TetR/AcrR family tetracycline transcriptional repressor